MASKNPSPDSAATLLHPTTEVDSATALEGARRRFGQRGRQAFGITGDAATTRLGDVVRQGKGWYPLSALGGLTIVDAFQAYAFFVLGPEIADTLGVNRTVVAGLATLRLLAVFASTLPAAALVQRRPRRAMLSVAAGFVWIFTAIGASLSRSALVLAIWLLVDGFVNGTVQALHRPLLIDSYPPAGRVRVLAAYRSANQIGAIVAPILVAVLTSVAALTWRGTYLVMAVLIVPAAVFAFRLRDPGFGTFDEQVVIDDIRNDSGVAEGDLKAEDVELGFFEIVRRLMLIPTIRRIMVGWAVLGMTLVPLNTYLIFFLEDRWGLGPSGRALLLATFPVFSIVALIASARKGESMFARSPGSLIRFAALALTAGVCLVGLAAAVPSGGFAVMVVLFGAGFACLSLVYPSLESAQLTTVPSKFRPHASALSGIYLSAVGGIGGVLLLGSIDRRFGTTGVFVPVAVLGVASALVLRSAAKSIDADLDRTVTQIVEAEEIRIMRASGQSIPMLTCRNINFSYGTVPILFDVNFTVDDGETVALLGTNGAGKSTLLRVVSGLGLPQQGSVRYRGQDITYIDAERRVRMGIVQVPGGKAAFGSLTVAENLRAAGYTLGRRRKEVEAGIEAAFEAFPRLGERRNQFASTLSGGEQQMLALSKSLILRPRLLVIDELSLGLAPKIVGELLQMVRKINQDGTAIILVEQSVNVALSIAEHAYFMEKGQIRFDGPSHELLGRGDLLRSVFLEGAASATESSVSA